MNHSATDDRCAPKALRSDRTTHLLTLGVVGVALCCALPSLLAGGALVAVAGWSWGVWAAIGVAAVAVGALWLQRRRSRADALPIDPAKEPLVESGAPKSAPMGWPSE